MDSVNQNYPSSACVYMSTKWAIKISKEFVRLISRYRGHQFEKYSRRICSTGTVMSWCWQKHGLPPARLRKVTWLEVVHRYWRGTGNRYHASTEICTGSVLALLRSRLLADTWSQDWGCTISVPCQPPTLESDFSTWFFSKIENISKIIKDTQKLIKFLGFY